MASTRKSTQKAASRQDIPAAFLSALAKLALFAVMFLSFPSAALTLN
jgi:hypothetical protein